MGFEMPKDNVVESLTIENGQIENSVNLDDGANMGEKNIIELSDRIKKERNMSEEEKEAVRERVKNLQNGLVRLEKLIQLNTDTVLRYRKEIDRRLDASESNTLPPDPAFEDMSIDQLENTLVLAEENVREIESNIEAIHDRLSMPLERKLSQEAA